MCTRVTSCGSCSNLYARNHHFCRVFSGCSMQTAFCLSSILHSQDDLGSCPDAGAWWVPTCRCSCTLQTQRFLCLPPAQLWLAAIEILLCLVAQSLLEHCQDHSVPQTTGRPPVHRHTSAGITFHLCEILMP